MPLRRLCCKTMVNCNRTTACFKTRGFGDLVSIELSCVACATFINLRTIIKLLTVTYYMTRLSYKVLDTQQTLYFMCCMCSIYERSNYYINIVLACMSNVVVYWIDLYSYESLTSVQIAIVQHISIYIKLLRVRYSLNDRFSFQGLYVLKIPQRLERLWR